MRERENRKEKKKKPISQTRNKCSFKTYVSFCLWLVVCAFYFMVCAMLLNTSVNAHDDDQWKCHVMQSLSSINHVKRQCVKYYRNRSHSESHACCAQCWRIRSNRNLCCWRSISYVIWARHGGLNFIAGFISFYWYQAHSRWRNSQFNSWLFHQLDHLVFFCFLLTSFKYHRINWRFLFEIEHFLSRHDSNS